MPIDNDIQIEDRNNTLNKEIIPNAKTDDKSYYTKEYDSDRMDIENISMSNEQLRTNKEIEGDIIYSNKVLTYMNCMLKKELVRIKQLLNKDCEDINHRYIEYMEGKCKTLNIAINNFKDQAKANSKSNISELTLNENSNTERDKSDNAVYFLLYRNH